MTYTQQLTRQGYKVTTVMGTGNIVVTDPRGFTKSFGKISEAYKFYNRGYREL